jgi:charged multivesicular body protein 1
MTVFERQFEDVDTATQLYDEMTSSATATSAPQDEVDKLMAQAADKAGVELNEDLQSATPAKTAIDTSEQGENVLSERLAALRN